MSTNAGVKPTKCDKCGLPLGQWCVKDTETQEWLCMDCIKEIAEIEPFHESILFKGGAILG